MKTVELVLDVYGLLVSFYFLNVVTFRLCVYLFRGNRNEDCYISGKITGLQKEDYEYNFNVAAKHVETHHNYTSVNPIKIVPYVEGKGWWYYMIRDIYHELGCSAIYMQSNWKESKGARIELFFAKLIWLKIIYEK